MLRKLGKIRTGIICVYLAGVVDDVLDEHLEERVDPFER